MIAHQEAPNPAFKEIIQTDGTTLPPWTVEEQLAPLSPNCVFDKPQKNSSGTTRTIFLAEGVKYEGHLPTGESVDIFTPPASQPDKRVFIKVDRSWTEDCFYIHRIRVHSFSPEQLTNPQLIRGYFGADLQLIWQNQTQQ
jgi:hypothetical protein